MTRPHGAGESDYKRCWNEIAADQAWAYLMVDESLTEEGLVQRGRFAAEALMQGLSLNGADVALEIGCGVARIGRELAGAVGRWIGVDVSENMLEIARKRLAAFSNVELVAGDGASLAGIADASIDKGYCHAVFIHMDKEDFFSYLLEVRRVLKPGGLFYFDVWNLCHEAGWLRWELERAMYHDRAHRPIHRNQFHTPDEVRTTLREAGLVPLMIAENYQVQVVATHRGSPSRDLERWVEQISAKYGRCFDHLRWRDDNVAEFVRLVKAELAKRKSDAGGRA